MLGVALWGDILVWVAVFWAHLADFGAHQLKPSWWLYIEKGVFCSSVDAGRKRGRWALGLGWLVALSCQAAGFALWWIRYWPTATDTRIPINVWYWVATADLGFVFFCWLWSRVVWGHSQFDEARRAEEQQSKLSTQGDGPAPPEEELKAGLLRIFVGMGCIALAMVCSGLMITLVAFQSIWLVMALFCPSAVMLFVALIFSIITAVKLNRLTNSEYDSLGQEDSIGNRMGRVSHMRLSSLKQPLVAK